MIIDAYAALSASGEANFQTTSPVVFFRATIVASAPPGVHTTTSPSTSGDSAYAQAPVLPPKCCLRFLVQTTLPVFVSRHARSPSDPSAKIRSPSTVGVERAPG